MNLLDSITYSQYKFPTTKVYQLAQKVDEFKRGWDKCKVENFRRCLDIGAHVGVYAFQYAQLFENVECFEPIPSLYEMLDYNTKPYKNINCHNIAVSDKDSTVLIYENPIRTESNVVVSEETKPLLDTRWTGVNSKWKDQSPISVPCNSIDSYNFTDVDFIKIDTEGYITSVLLGLKETLKNNSPVIHMEAPNEKEENSFLNKLGYYRYDRFKEDVYYIRN